MIYTCCYKQYFGSLCSRLRRILNASAQQSASWPCFTPGDRTFIFIPICTALLPGGGIGPERRELDRLPKAVLPSPNEVLGSRIPKRVSECYLRKAFEEGKLRFHGELSSAWRSRTRLQRYATRRRRSTMGGLRQATSRRTGAGSGSIWPAIRIALPFPIGDCCRWKTAG